MPTHAVGIDLGTTYSCIAHLNEQGEPVAIPNQEGEISTPSVVMFDGDDEIVGTEALRNAIMNPAHVVQNAKRWMGDPTKKWTIDGRTYTPVDISAAVLRKLLGDAERQIGKIDQAVITVPAQFSELQRQATVEAGRMAGLAHVEIINEPVAAALCYVLGIEGLWFTELASEQRILVYDLGGGTFDLSLVNYHENQVRVIASSGDLHLGGIDFNQAIVNAVAEQFVRKNSEDPREDLESLQHLAWEAEQCKRSLTVRPKASLICQHAGKREVYQIEQAQFNRLTQHLVKRTEEITVQILKDNKMGWAHVDVVLSTGGSSRMPMVRDMLKRLSGRTINTSLSPDQSIAHGAAYYAGMLLTNSEFAHSILNAEASARLAKLKQQSVNARALGILVRDEKTNRRVPYYLIPANTPLPTSVEHTFGTVIPNQKRVRLRLVESGAGSETEYVELGRCEVDGLPPNLPVDSEIAVTISYDSSARVHLSAREVKSGKAATTIIVRAENLVTRDFEGTTDDRDAEDDDSEEIVLLPVGASQIVPRLQESQGSLQPVALCKQCGETLNTRGECPVCQRKAARVHPVVKTKEQVAPPQPAATPKPRPSVKPIPMSLPTGASAANKVPQAKPSVKPQPRPAVSPAAKAPRSPEASGILKPTDDEIIELPVKKKPTPAPVPAPAPAAKKPKRAESQPMDPGEAEFWKMLAEE